VRGLPGFAGGERDFRAWVFTIAHRRLVDELRRRSRRPVDPVASVPERAGGDLREDAGVRLEDAAVREAIAGLPGEQQTVLLLRIIGDLTIEEIAAALGKRPGAIKALQRRALRKLQDAYPFEPDER